MAEFRAVVIGLGNRGQMQLKCFQKLPEYFEVVGICDRDEERLQDVGELYSIPEEKRYIDVDTMMQSLHPDIMAFVTMPEVRLELVKKAVQYKVKGLMFEKPMATTLREAYEILTLCKDNDIKAVVCHQHKYLPAFRKLRTCLDEKHLGKIYRIIAECQSQMGHIATHYIDYILWANDYIPAVSVVGHVHGSSSLDSTHPSPDFALGEVVMENGVRALLECGYMSTRHQEHMADFENDVYPDAYWTDCRLTVYGETGFAYAGCNGQYGEISSYTRGEKIEEQYGEFFKDTKSQVYYTEDFAKWLNGKKETHSCDVEQAYRGFEIYEGIYISALEHIRVDLPLETAIKQDTITRMMCEVPDIERKRFL